MEQTAKIKKFITLNPLLVCVVVYAICYVFRLIEYLVLRTDEGILGENLVHKIAGIAIIFIVLRILHLRWRDIGFRSKHWLKNIGLGLCLGAFFYAIAYTVEFIILHCQVASPTLKLIAGSFSLTKSNELVSVGIGFVILFNIIQKSLETLMKNRTSIVIAHRLSTIAKLDRIIVLENGRIVEDGSHDQLLAKKRGVYAKLWARQSGGFIEE